MKVRNGDTFHTKYLGKGQVHVNKLYFADHDGIEVLMKVYEALLLLPWENQSYTELKSTEQSILRVLWSFTVSHCQLVIRHKGIQMCTQSMLRVRLEEGKRIGEIVPSEERYVVQDPIFSAVGVLLK